MEDEFYDTNLSSEEEENETDDSDAQMGFVLLLKENKILLNKSKLQSVLQQKASALTNLTMLYNKNFKSNLSEANVAKKINNMKTRVKEKTDSNRTGNQPLKQLKPWETEFLRLWGSVNNPVINTVPGAVHAGILNNKRRSLTDTLPRPPSAQGGSGTGTTKKKRLDSTGQSDDLDELTLSELQRRTLIAQIHAAKAQREAAELQKEAAVVQKQAAEQQKNVAALQLDYYRQKNSNFLIDNLYN